MEHHAAEELYIIVYHLPFQVITTRSPVVVIDSLVAIDGDEVFSGVCSQLTVKVVCCDDGVLVLSEAASCLFDNGIYFWHYLVESLFIDFECLLLLFVNLGEDVSSFVQWRFLDGSLQAFNLLFLLFSRSLYLLANLLGTST